MKKTFLILNVLLIAYTVVGDICYMTFGGLLLKGLASAGFAALGIVNVIYALRQRTPLRFPAIMCAGLVLCMLGDIFLGIQFFSGVALFGLGHVFYFVAYCALMRFRPRDLIPGAVLFVCAALFVFLYPPFDFGSTLMLCVILAYALLISCMLGKAVANLLRQKNAVTWIVVIGCVLFFFSDLMLVIHMFTDAPWVIDRLCLITYYPAQCFLGFAVYQSVNANLHLTKQKN